MAVVPRDSSYWKSYYEANKEAWLARTSAWAKKNREKLNANQRKKNAANPEIKAAYAKKWNDANREKVRATWKKWAEENPEKYQEIKAKRRSAESAPAWADRAVMRAIYRVAAAWREAGVDVHVDHIVPLRAKEACGLHVEHNLNIVPAEVNYRKNNKLLEGVQ